MYLIDKIFVSPEAKQSNDAQQLIWSNIDMVNYYFDYYLNEDEIVVDALYSYYVDYYFAQVNNGGFSQFIYNTDNSDIVKNYVYMGLKAMQADAHLALFERAMKSVNELNEQEMQQFLSGDYFGDDNQQRHILNQFNDEFFQLDEHESLSDINAEWLKQHPLLTEIEQEQLENLLIELDKTIPDLEQRKQLAYENRPDYVKTIEAMCEKIGIELDMITAGIPDFEYQDEEYFAWYFTTNKGVFCMIELEEQEKALMFDADSRSLVLEYDLLQTS